MNFGRLRSLLYYTETKAFGLLNKQSSTFCRGIHCSVIARNANLKDTKGEGAASPLKTRSKDLTGDPSDEQNWLKRQAARAQVIRKLLLIGPVIIFAT
jgi:hypothetical protein